MSTSLAGHRAVLSVPQTIGTLAYRDVVSWRNRLRVLLLQSRWRGVAYAPALVFSVAGIAGRVLHRSGSNALLPIPHRWVALAATFLPAVVFTSLGGPALSYIRRGSPLFHPLSPDPYLLSGSAMPPRVVVLWLLLTRSRVVRLAVSATLVLLFLPSTFGVGGGVGASWVTVTRSLGLIAAAFSLPLFVLSRRLPMLPWRYLAYAVIGLGMVSATASGLVALHAGGTEVAQAQSVLLAIPPGSFAYDAVTGQYAGLAELGGVFALFALLTWWLAADCYPELYLAEQAHIQLAARRAGAVAENLRAGIAASQDGRVPAREWVLLWRWWVLQRRVSPRTRVLVYSGVIAVGGLAGLVMRNGPGWFSLAALVMFAMLASSQNGGNVLSVPASEFRTPMWHLVAAPLQNRLRMLTLTNSLSIWSYSAVLLLATGLARPALLPALLAGAASLAGFIWLRQSFEMMFGVLLPDSASQSSGRIVFPIVTVLGLTTGMVVFTSLAAELGPLALLLPLVLLLPAGYAVTGLAARMLSGNEIGVGLAATR